MDVGPFPTFDGVTWVWNSITRNGHISIITRLEGQLLVPRSMLLCYWCVLGWKIMPCGYGGRDYTPPVSLIPAPVRSWFQRQWGVDSSTSDVLSSTSDVHLQRQRFIGPAPVGYTSSTSEMWIPATLMYTSSARGVDSSAIEVWFPAPVMYSFNASEVLICAPVMYIYSGSEAYSQHQLIIVSSCSMALIPSPGNFSSTR